MVQWTYLAVIVADGLSAGVKFVGFATDPRADDPRRRKVLNRRRYLPNPSFSRSTSLVAAGPLILAVRASNAHLSSHEPLCTTKSWR